MLSLQVWKTTFKNQWLGLDLLFRPLSHRSTRQFQDQNIRSRLNSWTDFCEFFPYSISCVLILNSRKCSYPLPKSESSSLKRKVFQMTLSGTIPVEYQSHTYNIPVCLWIRNDHPTSAPMVYVTPTSDMRIKASRFVQQVWSLDRVKPTDPSQHPPKSLCSSPIWPPGISKITLKIGNYCPDPKSWKEEKEMAILCLYITEIIVPFNYNLLSLLVEHAYVLSIHFYIENVKKGGNLC